MEKKALDTLVLHVREITTVADFFVITSCESKRQVRSVADSIDEALSRCGVFPFSIEGLENSLWVLMDYSDLIVHIFKKEVREFYDLERLWGDAPRIDMRQSGGRKSRGLMER